MGYLSLFCSGRAFLGLGKCFFSWVDLFVREDVWDELFILFACITSHIWCIDIGNRSNCHFPDLAGN